MTINNAIVRSAQEFLESRRVPQLTEQQATARRWTLAQFLRACWPILEPSTPLVWGWHLDCLCSHVSALLRGQLGKHNLILLCPPGLGKSSVISVAAPVWWWVNYPNWSAMFASGNERVSTRDSLKRRYLLESPWFHRTFAPTWSLASDANLKTRYENTRRGFHQAMTTGQRATGDRSNAIFIDDPQDGATVHSVLERAKVDRWYPVIANRLSDMQRGTRCLIMQRLHSLDLAGWLIEHEREQWEIVTLPEEWDEGRRTVTSLGWTDPRQKDGELIFPARFPQHVIDGERQRLGRGGYASQHQQEPFDASGEIFRTDSIQFWPEGAPLPVFSNRILSLDTAFSTKSSADYSVILELGQFDRGIFIISCLRQRLEYPQLKAAALQLAAGGGIFGVLIEDKGSGISLAQDLRQQTSLPIVPVQVTADKVVRANICVPTVEGGRIFVPTGAPWVADFLSELAAFPKGSHDDMVDAFSMGVSHLVAMTGASGFLSWFAQDAATTKAVALVNRPNVVVRDLDIFGHSS
jgi:predicted phage terminase large subunit-like protein